MANNWVGFPGTEDAGKKKGGDARDTEQAAAAWGLQSKGNNVMQKNVD